MNKWPEAWNQARSTLIAELDLYSSETYGAIKNKFSFTNRGGKLYLTVTGDEAVIKFNINSEPWRRGVYKLVEKICPHAHMTSGGVNQFTFRLNMAETKAAMMKKDIYISKGTLRMNFSEIISRGHLRDGNYVLILGDNSQVFYNSSEKAMDTVDFFVYSWVRINVISK